MRTIKPSLGRVFARPRKSEERTKAGLFLPGKATIDDVVTAEVINGNDGYERGDVIMFLPYASTKVELNDDEYVIVATKDILGQIFEVEE